MHRFEIYEALTSAMIAADHTSNNRFTVGFLKGEVVVIPASINNTEIIYVSTLTSWTVREGMTCLQWDILVSRLLKTYKEKIECQTS